MRILVAGWSVRSPACSLHDAGYHVTAADAYKDADLNIRGIPLISFEEARRQHARYDMLLYGSNAEPLVEVFRGKIRGNSANMLRRLADVRAWFDFLDRAGIGFPRTWFSAADLPGHVEILEKNPSRHGGAGVRPWTGGAIPKGSILQEKLDARSFSASFFAVEGEVTLLGVTEQLGFDREISEALHVPGYAYCGNILLRDWDGKLLTRLSSIARCLAREYRLVGLNGIDFIMGEDHEPLLLELNPRWCASFELFERMPGFLPAIAQIEGQLPPITSLPVGATGKAILYAPDPGIHVPADSLKWLQDGMADVPMPGGVIEPRQPVCTVFAEADTRDACLDTLIEKAGMLYERLERNHAC